VVLSQKDLASTYVLRPPNRLVPNFGGRRSEVKNLKKNTSSNSIYKLAKVTGVSRIYTVGSE
jgi:hypothetical protein